MALGVDRLVLDPSVDGIMPAGSDVSSATSPQRPPLPPLRSTPGTAGSKTMYRSPSTSSAQFQPLLYHEGSSTQLRGATATSGPPRTSRAARPSTRASSKVWWSSCRAMDELYDSWTLEDSWHASQRDLQLEMLRYKKSMTQQRALGLGTLFELNQLKAQRKAQAVQRACDEAALAEIVFLPKLPAARAIAKSTWARDPMKLSAYDRAVAVSEVGELKEAVSVFAMIGFKNQAGKHAKEKFMDKLHRTSSKSLSHNSSGASGISSVDQPRQS